MSQSLPAESKQTASNHLTTDTHRPAGVDLRLQHSQARAFLFELMRKVQPLLADDGDIASILRSARAAKRFLRPEGLPATTCA